MVTVSHDDEPTVEYRTASDVAAPRPARPSAYSAGEVVAGRYRLVRRLGSGASAHVWLAHDRRLERDVAVKALHRPAAHGGTELERLRREARALARLNHPRITAVFDLIDDGDPVSSRPPVLVTELLTGEDLGARLRRGPMGLAETLNLGAQLADALTAAHRAGIIHRDIKPANVMLTPAGVKLFDFGVARTAADSDLTGATAIGTPACMAPEQWLGKHAEPATDVYALGCLLYWCLTGHGPFADRELPALAMAHLQFEPPTLPARGQDPKIDELYLTCLAKQPGHRPTARQVADVLARPSAPARRRARATASGVVPGRRRTPAAVHAGAVVGAACLIVGGALAIPLAASSTNSPTDQTAARTSPTPSTAASGPRGDGSAQPSKSDPTSAPRAESSAATGTPATTAITAAPAHLTAPPGGVKPTPKQHGPLRQTRTPPAKVKPKH
jgi:serine/threonine-protein kinase